MEPLSAVAGIIGTLNIAIRTTSSIIKYMGDTKSATSDRKLLVEEAQVLLNLLGRLRDRAQSLVHNEQWLADHAEIVRNFEVAVEDLLLLIKFDRSTGRLKEEGHFRAIRTAAKWSFTKSETYSVLERITRLQQAANTLLVDDQHALLERLGQKQQETSLMKMKADILNWLSPLQMSQLHQTISDRAQKGSGEWFLASEAVKKWRQEPQQPLWCWGIPGAGKTVLASIVVNSLRRDRAEDAKNTCGVVVVYLRYNDPEQTLDNILASILKQLCQDCDAVPPCILKLYEHHRERRTSPSLDEVSTTLTTLLATYAESFFVIDALDECSEELRWALLETLEDINPRLHLLITSRFLDSIHEDLADFDKFEIKANKADIELFIDHQIRKNRNLRRIVEKSPALRDDIKQGVVRTAEDMFLLARLHVESLASAAALSVKHVRMKLRSLPTTLTATYDEAMLRVENQEPDHRRFAFKILAWVTYAFRSLRLKELQHALVIEPGDTELDEELIIDGLGITSLCAGLVVVDPVTNQVALVHYSAKIYFEDIRHLRFPDFHASITLSCATYLTLKPLLHASIWDMVQDYPLATYAGQYMGDHARHSPEESLNPSVLKTICQLLSHPEKRKPLLALLDSLDLIKSGFYSHKTPATYQTSHLGNDQSTLNDMQSLFQTELDINDPTEPRFGADKSTSSETMLSRNRSFSMSTSTSSECISSLQSENFRHPRILEESEGYTDELATSRVPEVTALHLAASMGLAKVASLLLNQVPNIDAVDKTGKTALAVAIERGFEKAVEFLVTSGATVDLRTEHGQKVLLLVAERDWGNAGNIIAERARLASIDDSPIVKDQQSFLLAVYENALPTVQLLLEAGVLPHVSGEHMLERTALFLAVEQQHVEMVRLLLQAGVHVNLKDDSGQTSLHRAVRRENEALMRLLIRFGAEVDAKDDEGRTPWNAHARSCNAEILGILLTAGADPSTTSLQGISPLYTAAQNGETEFVKFLLNSGTNPSIQTQYDWAPLHWAASFGHVDCVQLLIQAGADLSPVSDQYVTPLDLAMKSNHEIVVDMLQKAGGKQYQALDISSSIATLKESEKERLHEDSPGTHSNQNDSGNFTDKVTLVFDMPLARTLMGQMLVGQFVYPPRSRDPIHHVYEISHFLETLTGFITVKRASLQSTMSEVRRTWHAVANGQTQIDAEYFATQDALYDICCLRTDYQAFELRPKHLIADYGILSMKKDWTGGWKITPEHNSETVFFRTTPEWSKMKGEECRWVTKDGTMLARTGCEDDTPNLFFEYGVTRSMQDVIVTCWIAKLWSESVGSLRRDSAK